MDICKTWNVKPDDVLELKTWYKQQDKFPPDTPDEYFAMTIHSCYSDMNKAKRVVEAYFQVKMRSPELFAKRFLSELSVQRAIKVSPTMILPTKTVDGYTVIWSVLKNEPTSEFFLDEVLKYMFMVIDIALLENPGCPGIVFVHDEYHFSFKHLFKMPFSTFRKYFQYVQDACPIRVKGIHLINVGTAVSYTVNICKPLTYKEYAKILFLHSGHNIENLTKHSKITKDMVPLEYGGNEVSIEELIEDTAQKVEKHAEWFKLDERIVFRQEM